MVMSMHRNPGKKAASNDDLIQSISPVSVYFFIWNCSNMGHPTTMNPSMVPGPPLGNRDVHTDHSLEGSPLCWPEPFSQEGSENLKMGNA